MKRESINHWHYIQQVVSKERRPNIWKKILYIVITKKKCLKKNKKRAERRKKDFSKAMRKKNLDKAIRPNWQPWYSNLHEYSKNKIHCSCPLCRFKNWYDGKDRKTTSDMKKIESMEDKIREYKAG